MEVKELKLDLEPEEQDPELRAKKEVLSRIIRGNWKTLFKGQGMEFAGFRKYTPEDDASDIDWKASLKSDETLVREYEEYKTLNVYIVLDVSDTMLFSSTEKLKAEYGAELAYALAEAIQQTGEAVGMSMVTDRFVVNFPPETGTQLTVRYKRELRNKENYGGKSDIKQILKLINTTVAEPALIIFISDFIGLEEGWGRYLDIIAQSMDIMGIMIRDPRDTRFPSVSGQFVLEHPSKEESILVDTKRVSEAYEQRVKEEEEKIAAAFRKTNSGFVKISTGEDMYGPLMEYFYQMKRILER